LGPLFEAAFEQRRRHAEGQFFTPSCVAAHMASLFDGEEVETLLDPAAGAGALLAASARPGRRLIGIERDPLLAGLARAGLAARGVEGVEIRAEDFLRADSSPPRNAPEIDAIIANPPYLRHHLLAPADKTRLAARAREAFKVQLSSLSSGFVYFLFESLRRLREGGLLVFLTPSEYLDARYGEPLKRLFSEGIHLERLELFDRRTLAFEGVLTTSVITALRKRPAGRRTSRFIELRRTEAGIETLSERRRPARLLPPTSSWTLGFGDGRARHRGLVAARPHLLSEFLRVRRGIATGANAFFLLRDAEARAWGIEPSALRRVIASAKDLPDRMLSRADWERLRGADRPCWLLDCDRTLDELVGTPLRAYLEHGRRLAVHERQSCRARRPWYRIERVPAPDLIITYMNRGPIRFVQNEAEVQLMSSLLNGYLLGQPCPREQALRWLLETLRAESSLSLIADLGRTYGGGLQKIEPRELLSLPMPRPPWWY
ncbi:MAG: class I SAM-dependent methyltransferase, partial [Myxococcales bacterium]|nr:class I SAM-dependent methyltransferase [Myxococcales bacterium]